MAQKRKKGSWTAKDERQYKAIVRSCRKKRRGRKRRGIAECERIAAATVNKLRRDRRGRFKAPELRRREERRRQYRLRRDGVGVCDCEK